MAAQKHAIGELDAVRGVAALVVAIWHWFSMGRLPNPWFQPLSDFFYRASEYAVSTFFVLSGCVLTLSILRARDKPVLSMLATYARRRFLRIMPLVFLVVTVSYGWMLWLRELLDIDTPWKRYSDVSIRRVVEGWLLSDSHYNPPGWSLQYEACAYIVLPFLILALIRTGLIRVAAILIFIVASIVLARYWTGWPAFLQMMPMFLPGIALAFVAPTKSGAFIFLAIGVFALTTLPWISPIHYGIPIASATACACILAAAMNSTDQAHRTLQHPAFKWLGDISYSVYLWHYPILWSLFYLFGDFVGTKDLATWLWVGVVGLPLTLGVSALSYRFWERPVMAFPETMRRWAQEDVTGPPQPSPAQQRSGSSRPPYSTGAGRSS